MRIAYKSSKKEFNATTDYFKLLLLGNCIAAYIVLINLINILFLNYVSGFCFYFNYNFYGTDLIFIATCKKYFHFLYLFNFVLLVLPWIILCCFAEVHYLNHSNISTFRIIVNSTNNTCCPVLMQPNNFMIICII